MADPKWQEMSKESHIHLRPEVYVGTMQAEVRPLYVMKDGVQVLVDMKVSAALLRIFIEIICNAADNVNESREVGIAPGIIEVIVEGEEITVKNGGRPMPIAKMKCDDGKMDWIPTVMFSRMFSSSHYDDTIERTTAGLNGIGAKACNILSSLLRLVVRDGKNQLEQSWTEGALKSSGATVTPCTESSLVSVSFTPNMKRFSGSISLASHPEILSKYCADIALACRVPVLFTALGTTTTYDFTKSIKGAMTIRGCARYSYHSTDNHQIYILDSDELIQESFVNCTPTYRHGTHVNTLLEMIRKEVKTYKGLEKVNKRILSSCLSFVVYSRIVLPRFDGNNKDLLTNETVEGMNWPKLGEELKSMPRILQRIEKALKIAQMNSLNTSSRVISDKNLRDANMARLGKKGNRPVTLWVTEGTSARPYVLDMIQALYGNYEYDGVLTLRGKPLNVRAHSLDRVAKNEEIKLLISALGLKIGVSYTHEEVRERMRYDRLVIASDADDDGTHIRGILIDIIAQFVPTLLSHDFIYIMQSPRYRLNNLIFYTEDEWIAWQRNNVGKYSTAAVEYCKGLGASGLEYVPRDSQEGEGKILQKVSAPSLSMEALELAFSSDVSDLRKEWLLGNIEVESDDNPYSIPNIIQQDLRAYSLQTLRRSIPAIDGLVESQRMLIWTMMQKPGRKKCNVVMGEVMSTVNYKHGEKSMYGALVGLGAGYPGSNNLPLIQPKGNLGSRNMLSKDRAGQRYPAASLRPFVSKIFRKNDLPLLTPKEEDGGQYEPLFLLPVIPLWLMNTVEGIATGWSTFIPPHDPKKVMERMRWELRARLGRKEAEPAPLVPWFRYFLGKSECRVALTDEVISNREDGTSWTLKKGQRIMVVKGRRGTVTRTKEKEIHITEIPTYIALDKYRTDIEKFCRDNKYKLIRNNTNRVVDVLISIPLTATVTDKDLGLVRKETLSNMHILNDNGLPRLIDSAEHGIEVFLEWRLPYYELRRQHELKRVQTLIDEEEGFITFLTDVLDRKFDPRASRDLCTMAQYTKYLEDNGYTLKAADRYKVWHSRPMLEQCEVTRKTLQEEYDVLSATRPEEMMMDDLNDLERAIDKYYASDLSLVDISSENKKAKKR